MNPGMSAVEVTKELGKMWQSVSAEEKKRYKEKAAELNGRDEEHCPRCDDKFANKTEVIEHMLMKHLQDNPTTPREANQATIKKCETCGRMFFNEERLKEHQMIDHGLESVQDIEAPVPMAEQLVDETEKEADTSV